MSRSRLNLLVFFLLLTSSASAQPQPGAIKNIQEEDGSPDIFPWQLRVTNGQLTDNGDGTASLSISGGGAPTDADYLVGTTNGSLSAEIVVGTTPGGALGGTWASPTIDLDTLPNRISPFTSSTLRANTFDTTGTGSAVYNNTPTITDTTLKNTFIFEQTGGADVVTGATGGIGITGNIQVSQLASCDTIDTDSTGIFRCGNDGGAGGGDSITVNSSATTDPDFLNGDIDWTLTGGNSITATVGCTDCVDQAEIAGQTSAQVSGNWLKDFTGTGVLTFNSSPLITSPSINTSILTNYLTASRFLNSDSSQGIATNGGSSTMLANSLSDESGTGVSVFNTSPTITSPTINTSLVTNYLTASRFINSDSNKGVATNSGSSTMLANSISDETGTGQLVYNTSPTITSPTINTSLITDYLTASKFLNSDGSRGIASNSGTSTMLMNSLSDESGTGVAVFNNTPTITDVTLKNTFIFEQTGGADVVTGATGGMKVTGNIQVSQLASCDTIDTDSTGIFRCGNDGGGGTPGWTDNGAEVNLTTSTDDVEIGNASAIAAKVAIDGDSDEVQFQVQGNSTQTTNLFVVEQSSGTDTITGATGGILGGVPFVVSTGFTSPNILNNGLSTNGVILSTASSDIGWAIIDPTDNIACNTSCVNGCVFGIANASGVAVTTLVNCTDATADLCLCAGAN